MSIVYLIGAGPGDPGLITVRGLQCLAAADVVLYDHLVHARLLRSARADAETDRRRHRRAAAARAGGDLLPARREGARGQDRRAAEVGRSVRVRQRRHGSAVPARAGRAASRSCPAFRPASRVPGYAGIPITYPGGGDTLTFVRGHEDEGKTRRVDRLGQPGAARRHARLLRRAAAAAARCSTRCSRTAGPPDDSAALIYDGTLPTQQTHRRHARRDRARRSSSADDRRPAILVVGRVVGAARAPALVRRAAAVRQAHPGHAAARAGRRARRAARGAGRRGDRGADDPHPAARGLRRRSTTPARDAGDLRLDRLLERQRRRRVHGPAARRRRATCARSAA